MFNYSKMSFTALRPIIYSLNIKETCDFYCKYLGFSIAEFNENWQWACLNNNSIEIMVAHLIVNSKATTPIFTGSFYFNTNQVDTDWEKLKNEVNICYEIETFEWGMREFAIYDNNEYVIQIGQEV